MTRRLDCRLHVLDLGARRVQVRQRGNGGLGLLQPGSGPQGLLLVSRHGQTRAFQLAARDGPFGLGPRQRARRLGHAPVRLAPGLARRPVGLGRRRKLAGQKFVRLPRALGPRADLLKVALQFDQAVQLLQPQGRGLGRILRCGAEPVPSP